MKEEKGGLSVVSLMGVSKTNGTPKSSILIEFSMKKNIHFGGLSP